jgi:hypothetical protein
MVYVRSSEPEEHRRHLMRGPHMTGDNIIWKKLRNSSSQCACNGNQHYALFICSLFRHYNSTYFGLASRLSSGGNNVCIQQWYVA